MYIHVECMDLASWRGVSAWVYMLGFALCLLLVTASCLDCSDVDLQVGSMVA